MAIWYDGEGCLPIGQIVLAKQRGGKKMLVFGQVVFLVPSPTPFPPIFLLLLNLFNMVPEIEFASLNFPPSHKTVSYAGY